MNILLVLAVKYFKHASFKFIEYRKIAYGISVVVLLLGIGSFFNGFDEGVEFSGGRSYTVKFDKPVNDDEVRNSLKSRIMVNILLLKQSVQTAS